MKKICSIIVALLLVALSVAATGCDIFGSNVLKMKTYDDADRYSTGEYNEASDITKIEVDWLSCYVVVEVHDYNEFFAHESFSLDNCQVPSDEIPTQQSMHWYLDGTTLKIKFWESGYSSTENIEKHLVVRVPASVSKNVSVEVNTTSANILLRDDADFQKVDFETISGNIDCSGWLTATESVKFQSVSGNVTASITEKVSSAGVDTPELEVETTSGNINVYAKRFGGKNMINVDIETVSGACKLYLQNMSKAEIESTSGKVDVYVQSAKVTFNTKSGELHNQTGEEYSLIGTEYVFGTGSSIIEVSTVSGNLFVH